MLKNFWFQSHWLLGITAGVVLAVVGLTGATLSYEQDILRLLNPTVMTVTPDPAGPLPPAELMRRVRATSDKPIIGLTLASDPTAAAQIGFAGGRRGDWHYLNPYTGALLGKPERGEATLHVMEDIHRRLAAGDTGKQLVGASTIMLLVLALSGLYLRWPRQAGNWRTWLSFSWARKGRSFLWDMHSVIGTWVLPLYLLAALTGLFWSYEWYRNGLYDLTGAPRPTPPPSQMAPAEKPATEKNAGDRQAGNGNGNAAERRAEPRANTPLFADADIERAWQTFHDTIPAGYRTATLRLPERAGGALEFRYLDADPAHGRANNTLSLETGTFAVQKHERYADQKAGTKLMRSMFALHSGEFFGAVGLLVMMLASLLMPLFAITGWMLYLDRRGKKRAAKKAAKTLLINDEPNSREPLLIAYASQTGYAEQLAWQSAGMLQAAGLPVQVHAIARVDGAALARFKQALFVVSTFGDGEAPDGARGFAKQVLQETASLAHLRYAVLALGDKQYQAFCGFGRAIDQWLRQHGANAMFAPIEVDKGDPQALADWQQQLQQLSGSEETVEWGAQRFQDWQLLERRQLNVGSQGAPMFHLALQAPAATSWQAGDLLDVLPQQPAEIVEQMRVGLAFANDAQVDGEPITHWLRRQECPSPEQMQAWRQLPDAERLSRLQPLQVRTYSIASIPADGSLHLLVRQEQHADGSLGAGSGWLTQHVSPQSTVTATVRANPGFHCDDYSSPLILIGNGSGLSALRAHLRAAEQAGKTGHWLIFGERSRASDYLYQDDVERWQKSAILARLDLAFSRDQVSRIYVQDRLRAAADTLKSWIDNGACIYVCGSAQGMAPAVEQVLIDVLGAERVSELLERGRYRRDVY